MIPTDDFTDGVYVWTKGISVPGDFNALEHTIVVTGNGGWFVLPAKREPTPEEKTIHRAIGFDNGDAKRYGHRNYTGDEE